MLPFRIAIIMLSLFVIALACDKPVIIQIEDVNGEATCVVTPQLADFGALSLGNETEELFTIRNVGGGTLTGVLSLADSTGSFEIVSGGGAFQLRGGERRVVLVRFAPTAAGELTCRLSTNTGCRTVVCTGIGRVGPTCELTPASIVFPSVTVGMDTVETFTVANNGDEALFGNLFASCDRFQIQSGDGPFILGPDSSFQVAVRFAPGDTLFEECSIFLSGDACDSVAVSGRGTRALFPECAVSATSLDFGIIETATGVEQTLRVFNVGEASLTGSVSIGAPCAPFSLVSGGGAYTIPPNDSLLVVVAFAPGSDPGVFACSLSLGTPFCPDPIALAGTADAPAVCAIEPGTIDFGTVFTGSEATQSFVVRNDGGSTLAGVIGETCDDVSITGGGAYSLAAGESLVVAVSYSPGAPGSLACSLSVGNALCAEPLVLTGSAIAPGACAVSETTVDFGTVTVGESASLSFTLTNDGGADFDGAIGSACAPFTIDAGGGAYTLAPQEVRTVDISFAPLSGGAFVCTLETGCDSRVVLRGEGDPPAICRLEPDSLDFGSINPGQEVTRSFTIANDGGQILAGRMSIPCQANFRLVEGEDPEFSLGGGESRVVTVRFSPQLQGEKKCTFTFGNTPCGTIEAVGFGDEFAECLISPTNLSFPNRTIGEDTTLAFVVKNTGGSTLSGTVTAPCEHFSVVSGTEEYALAADESDTVQVRFAPTAAGQLNCTIVTGCAQNVDVSGTGQLPPICSLFVANTAFDTVTIGSSRDLDVSVSNIGAGALTGSLVLTCDDYAVTGSSDYSLGAGATAVFTVRYTPSDTLETTCDVTTGCDSTITFSGRGVRAPVCALSTVTVDFDSVLVGESASDSFTITNTGGGILSGAVSEACGDLTVTAGAGSYALAEGESRLVTLLFAPASQGP
ncbi:MAG: choice-of-anchor D domain-containing protein, partial [Gemmatimonadetes bacterium]|nr:choice-of-anchor D domain-containing protein [Gemmatimonadota bacterium]